MTWLIYDPNFQLYWLTLYIATGSCARSCYKKHVGREVSKYIWAGPLENVSYVICEQQRHRSACTSTQSDQHLCCLLLRKYNISRFYSRNFKTLASLCGCAGWFVSGLVGNSRRHVFSRRGSHKDPKIRSVEKLRQLSWNLNHVVLTYTTGSNRWAVTWQNKQSECAPSEDSDQPGYPPSLIRVFLSAWRKLGSLATQWAHSEDSDRTGDAQADLSLCWAHTPFVGFLMSWLRCRWNGKQSSLIWVYTFLDLSVRIFRPKKTKNNLIKLNDNAERPYLAFSKLKPKTHIYLFLALVYLKWLMFVKNWSF